MRLFFLEIIFIKEKIEIKNNIIEVSILQVIQALKMNTQTEMNNEIMELTLPTKKVKVITTNRKLKTPAAKKVIVDDEDTVTLTVGADAVTVEDTAEDTVTAGNELELTNPIIIVEPQEEVKDLFAELQKQYQAEETDLEEHLDQQDQLADILTEQLEEDLATTEEDGMEALLKEKADLELRIQKYEQSKMVRRLATDYRALLMKNREEKWADIRKQMRLLQAESEMIATEMEGLRGISDDELTETILSDPKLKAECGFSPKKEAPVMDEKAKREYEKAIYKTPPPTKTKDGAPRTLTKIDRKLSHSKLPTNAVLIAKLGDKVFYIRKNSKGTFTEVPDIQAPMKRIKDTQEFPDVTVAAKYFMENICDKKGGNAWAIYKAYNKVTKKGESIEGINVKSVYECADVDKYLA